MLKKASYSQKLRLWAEAYFHALPWEIDKMTDEQLEIRLIYSAYMPTHEEFRTNYFESKRKQEMADSLTEEQLAEAGYTPEEMAKIYEEIRNG